MELVKAVLDSSYEPPLGTDHHTNEILKLLECTEIIRKVGPLNTTIAKDDFIEHWKGHQEDTLSFIYGMYFGHYKADAFRPFMGKTHYLFKHIATEYGPPPKMVPWNPYHAI